MDKLTSTPWAIVVRLLGVSPAICALGRADIVVSRIRRQFLAAYLTCGFHFQSHFHVLFWLASKSLARHERWRLFQNFITVQNSPLPWLPQAVLPAAEARRPRPGSSLLTAHSRYAWTGSP